MEPRTLRTQRIRTAALGGAGLAAVVIAALALGDRVPPFDTWIVDHLYAAPGTAAAAAADAVSGIATVFGLGLMVVAVVALLRRRGTPRGSVLIKAAAVLVLCLAVVGLQALFQRSGPPVTTQDWTYPSGHVTVLTALAFTAFVISGQVGPRLRTAVTVSGILALILVAAGRVTSGEHYLLDVVAAFTAVVGVGLLAAVAFRLHPIGVHASPA
jgi:undecaprenyl-diphosphatase